MRSLLHSGRLKRPLMQTGTVLALAGALSLVGLFVRGCSWARMDAGSGPKSALPAPDQLTVDVKEFLGFARNHWPVTVGVPFPSGMVTDPSRLTLADDHNAAAPLQTRVLSRWPDGSVRWALLDWQADLEAQQQRVFRVIPGPPAPASQGVRVRDLADRLDIDTGPLQFSIPKKRFAWLQQARLNGVDILSGPISSFFNVDGKRIDGQAPTSVSITESGPARVRVEIRGRYGAAFDYIVRVDAFANQPFVRVLHTFEQHSAEAYTSVRQIGATIPLSLRDKAWYRVGQENAPELSGRLRSDGISIVQEDNETVVVGGSRRPGRASGWIDVGDEQRGVAVAARFFWEQYPQGFRLQPSGVTYNLWAPEVAPAKVGMGSAKTHEVTLYFHDKKPPPLLAIRALTTPLRGWTDPRWTVFSGALRNSIIPSPATDTFLHELNAGYRRYLETADKERWDDSGQVRCPEPAQERPRHGFYGMFNWGDWNYPGYHDTTKGCDAWGNLEYDMTQVLALAYAATGERAYHEGMLVAARHFMDVDRIHYQYEHADWVGMNHPKNPLHFTFELGGVDLGHTWTEGLLSYYYLTGDDRALDAARGIADYLVTRVQGWITYGNPRQWGWPQIALVATYEATGDPKYKEAARAYARRGMRYAPDRFKDFKMGVLAEGLAYTHSITGDNDIADWLNQYAAAVHGQGATADARFLPALAYVARLRARPEYARTASASVMRLKFGNWAKPFTIAGRLGFAILSQMP